MTDKISHKKVKVTKYSLGEGDYFMITPSIRGYYCWGSVAGKPIEVEDKDLKGIEKKISDYLTKEKIDYLNKASRCEEISLRINESGLEKTAKELGEKK